MPTEIFNDSADQHDTRLAEVLRELPFFKDADVDGLVRAYGKDIDFILCKDKETITLQDDEADYVYIPYSDHSCVLLGTVNERNGYERNTEILRKGGILGFTHMITDKENPLFKRQATVVGGDAGLLRIPIETARGMLTKYNLWENASQYSERQRGRISERMATVMNRGGMNKLARVLIDVTNAQGQKTPDGKPVLTDISHAQLATLTGTARKDVSHHMKALKEAGVLQADVRYDRIITKVEVLERLSSKPALSLEQALIPSQDESTMGPLNGRDSEVKSFGDDKLAVISSALDALPLLRGKNIADVIAPLLDDITVHHHKKGSVLRPYNGNDQTVFIPISEGSCIFMSHIFGNPSGPLKPKATEISTTEILSRGGIIGLQAAVANGNGVASSTVQARVQGKGADILEMPLHVGKEIMDKLNLWEAACLHSEKRRRDMAERQAIVMEGSRSTPKIAQVIYDLARACGTPMGHGGKSLARLTGFTQTELVELSGVGREQISRRRGALPELAERGLVKKGKDYGLKPGGDIIIPDMAALRAFALGEDVDLNRPPPSPAGVAEQLEVTPDVAAFG